MKGVFKDPNFASWSNKSHKETIDEIRGLYNFQSISEKEFECSRCGYRYITQTIGGRKVEFYCVDCHTGQRLIDNMILY